MPLFVSGADEIQRGFEHMKMLHKLRYYTLSREAHTQCVKAESMNSLKLMLIAGTLYTIICVYAVINFIISDAVQNHFAPAMAFAVLAVVSTVYGLASLIRYRQYNTKDGKPAESRLVYTAMIAGYVVIMLSTIYTEIWVAPWGIPAVFVAFLGGGLLLLPPHFFISLFITLAMFVIYLASSLMTVTPECCWVCQLSDAFFGVIISLALMWYVNMHKLVATNTNILLRDERDKYAQKSLTDDLSLLPNYRGFMQRLERYLKQFRKTDTYMCLAVMDIDRFKQYNDYYGHPQGDECLRMVGEALGKAWENSSMYAARIGGEEFALLWFEKDSDNVKEIAEEVQRRIYDLQIPHTMSDIAPYVTFSVGIDISPSGKYDNTRSAYTAADNALYAAKENGRNNVVIVCEGRQFD
jgi:diguanylate cyclase (GGDEF)-like protein